MSEATREAARAMAQHQAEREALARFGAGSGGGVMARAKQAVRLTLPNGDARLKVWWTGRRIAIHLSGREADPTVAYDAYTLREFCQALGLSRGRVERALTEWGPATTARRKP